MDPVSLFFLLGGFKATEELMVKLGLTQNTALQPMNFRQYILSRRAIETIKLYETLHPYGMNVGDGYSTIGYGTVNCFYDNGKPLGRPVKFGETLSQLRISMGYNNLNDIQFAERLMINHSKVSTYNLIATKLDSLNVKYNQGLAEALSEWSYGTGCAFYETKKQCNSPFIIASYNKFLNLIVLANNNNKALANAYFWYRFTYLQSLRLFPQYAFGWLKRAYVSAMLITDPSLDTVQLKKTLDIKNRDYLKSLIRINFDASYLLGW